MPTAEGLALNWRQPRTNPGYVVGVPSNYGTDGRVSFWHWVRAALIPQVPNPRSAMYNSLAPVNYHLGVTVVPVRLLMPVQTTPQLAFTPAGTASASPGAGAAFKDSQVWTGAV